ncbi:hypothetical protein [Magnetospirillum gryphiswaldense]|uniref:ATPases with chaperone activity, ATP-binding subunit n=1 Tax=Magnetospirillum gryphiswaldense TaxID=55518 RepID=A4TZ06_9PROT|nr:hypothetical protein [Magnetospirillum gryphiswaldense]AVM73151.1 hypothetical protein MSR1_06410 [Magnetospirillum gryphiswaldense MSR-1]AVM77054.1 hypothetical protein MSR1L_06410 [Magnetospirillum gryphiswaldense]CAM75863.1 ATPases with chaperone activity, ATP-binding subunit [Magnetospirillum gryphiswaldense MSR-1]
MTTSIYIDLNSSSDPRVLNGRRDNLIQQEALDRALQRICATLKKVDDFKESLKADRDDAPYLRHHDVITIDGPRGSGKTTFILNLFHHVKNASKDVFGKVQSANAYDDDDFSRKLGRVEILGIIDPTLIESKENIIVTIISFIKRKVDSHCKDSSIAQTKDYEAFREKLRDLARGLQLLDSIGPDNLFGDDWADPAWILEAGLKNARSGTDFERCFHDFIRFSLEMLGRDAFLLAFDDIDTSFERGWPVLEIIRKYLTSPQLITILSGHMELFGKLVRKHQFQNLGRELLDYDRPGQSHHAPPFTRWKDDKIVRLVDQLEDQYLLKIMKPENRISLIPLDHYVRVLADKYSIHVTTGKSGSPLSLTAYIDQALMDQMALSHSIEKLGVFRSVILRQPVRTAVQFLIAAREANGSTDGRFVERLAEIGAAALFHMDLSPEQVSFADGNELLWLIVKWIDKNDLWGEGYRMVPNHRDEDLNMVALILGGRLAAAMREAADLSLLQILQIGLIRELKVGLWQKSSPGTSELLQYLDLELTEKPSTVARRLVAAFRSMRDGERFRHQPFVGTVPISGASFDQDTAAAVLYRVAKKDELKELSIDRAPLPMNAYWEQAFGAFDRKRARSWHKQVTMNTLGSLAQGLGPQSWMVNLPALIVPDPTTGRNTTFYSIYSLLGVIAELMALDSSDPVSVEAALIRLGQIRTYPLPPWSHKTASPPAASETEEEGDEEEGDDADEGEKATSPLAHAVSAWLKRIRDRGHRAKIAYHPHVIARVGTRFYYTMQRFDEEARTADKYLGNLIHRQIISFLNAVVVEERLARGGLPKDETLAPSDVDLLNPTLDDYRFLRNIPKKKSADRKGPKSELPQRIKEDNTFNNEILAPEACPLLYTFFSCPILALYVSPASPMRWGAANITWNVLEAMQRSWGEVDDENTTKVTFRFNVQGTEKKDAAFPNLHSLLNSVPVLQGQE